MVVHAPTRPADRANHFVFHNASWAFYQSVLDQVGNGNIRVTYDKGKLEIMSPLPEHEYGKKLIAQLIELMTFDRRVRRASFGSTTYSDETLEKGLEPDECYYFANRERVRGLRRKIDLKIDPPPDLVIEIDISYRAIKRESIYAAMKVPEIWRYDGVTIECLTLDERSIYRPSEFSRSLPFLRVADLKRFVDMGIDGDEIDMLEAFRQWLTTLPKS